MATATQHPQIRISTHPAVLFITKSLANNSEKTTSGTTRPGEHDSDDSDTGSSRGPSLRPEPQSRTIPTPTQEDIAPDQVEEPQSQPTDTHLLAMIEGLLSNFGDIFLFFFGCCEEEDPETTKQLRNKHSPRPRS
jgi:hypothetical protein